MSAARVDGEGMTQTSASHTIAGSDKRVGDHINSPDRTNACDSLTEAQIAEKAAYLARGIPEAALLFVGPDLATALPRWFPKLRGGLVHNADDPDNGFGTQAEALVAARKYADGCANFAARYAGGSQ